MAHPWPGKAKLLHREPLVAVEGDESRDRLLPLEATTRTRLCSARELRLGLGRRLLTGSQRFADADGRRGEWSGEGEADHAEQAARSDRDEEHCERVEAERRAEDERLDQLLQRA